MQFYDSTISHTCGSVLLTLGEFGNDALKLSRAAFETLPVIRAFNKFLKVFGDKVCVWSVLRDPSYLDWTIWLFWSQIWGLTRAFIEFVLSRGLRPVQSRPWGGKIFFVCNDALRLKNFLQRVPQAPVLSCAEELFFQWFVARLGFISHASMPACSTTKKKFYKSRNKGSL